MFSCTGVGDGVLMVMCGNVTNMYVYYIIFGDIHT